MCLRDIQSIGVRGNASEVDSLVTCLQAALAHWDRQVPYDCIAGLCGSAFSPALNLSEECAAWWMEGGADIRIDFLGHALGFVYEKEDYREETAPDLAPRARKTLADGGVVLCETWPCWSLLTAWQAKPEHRSFVAPEGCERLLKLREGAAIYFLGPAGRSLSSCEGLYSALGFGALVAADPGISDGVAYGGQLYDAWAKRMGRDRFCPPCGDDDWRCAERTVSRVRAGQKSAVRFLNRAYDFLPSSQKNEHLRHAACSYAAMAARLAPYEAGLVDGWQNRGFRRRLREDVGRCRELHREAARHLLRATSAISA
jgi:hypothetical protein